MNSRQRRKVRRTWKPLKETPFFEKPVTATEAIESSKNHPVFAELKEEQGRFTEEVRVAFEERIKEELIQIKEKLPHVEVTFGNG